MLRVFVDSGSRIKQDEKEKYQVDIIPLRYIMGDKEYNDGLDISIDEFYDLLINKKHFPKTSLPSLIEAKEKIEYYTNLGDDVIVITISSGLSGTHSALSSMFVGNSKVKVVDSLSAVGGVRILLHEINKHRDESLDKLVLRLNNIIPRIKVLAIPETLNYLMKGGRLSKKDWLLGTVLKIKPLITLSNGKVKVESKKIGLKNAMQALAKGLVKFDCDTKYPIVPSFTYNKDNLDKLIAITDEKYKQYMIEFDNLDPVIACHWGPNAFGYIFVTK